MITITYTDRFKKHYQKLTEKEKDAFKTKFKQFVADPTIPSLRIKKVQGTKGLFEFSVNMDIRVIWHYEGEELVILVDIGHHDILKQY